VKGRVRDLREGTVPAFTGKDRGSNAISRNSRSTGRDSKKITWVM
jgi:hypothetical protein